MKIPNSYDAMELRHLRYFLAVAETENFTRAADRLRVTQPSVSQQVAQLEALLGIALFRRTGKRVQLTDAGAAFREHAEAILRKLDEARASLRRVAGVLNGHVQLAAIPVLHVAWVPWVLERMARDYPGVTIRVQQYASSDIETALEAGRSDLGFGLVTRASPAVRYEQLLAQPFSLIVPANSRFAGRKSVALSALDGERLVMLPNSFDMRRMADAMFRRLRIRPQVVFELDNIDTVLRSVRRAHTPTLLPAVALRGREALGLRAVRLAGDLDQIEFGLLWPAAGSVNPAARAVAASLKAMLKGSA